MLRIEEGRREPALHRLLARIILFVGWGEFDVSDLSTVDNGKASKNSV